MIAYLTHMCVTFLSLNKKVTKEVGTGEALGANAPSPVYPTRRTFERSPSSIHLRTDGRKSVHFRLIVIFLRPFFAGGGFIRGTACKKSPLYRLLFALFLPNQEKGKENVSKLNDHLYRYFSV